MHLPRTYKSGLIRLDYVKRNLLQIQVAYYLLQGELTLILKVAQYMELSSL